MALGGGQTAALAVYGTTVASLAGQVEYALWQPTRTQVLTHCAGGRSIRELAGGRGMLFYMRGGSVCPV